MDKRRKPRHRGRVYHFVLGLWRAKEADSDQMKYWE